MRLSEIKHDINVLAELLSSWGKFVKNPEVLHNISIVKNRDSFTYSINDPEFLIFQKFDIERHSIPHGLEKINEEEIDKQIKLNVLFEERFELVNEYDDRVLRLGLNLLIEVKYFIGDDLSELYSGWHFDKGECGISEFSHPIYHCTYGGKSLKPFGKELGRLFSNAGPRIVHPPLELILGVDFIIKNYYKKEKHQKISEDPRYIGIVNRAHFYYWLPYSMAIQKINPIFSIDSNLDFRSVKGF